MEIVKEDIEAKAAQYEQGAQTHLANYHRLSGAAAGLRELLKPKAEEKPDATP